MDAKNAKELIDQRKIDLSLKRKRAAKCAALFVRIAGEKLAARKTHSMRFDTGEDRVFKRIKLFERKNNYFCSSLLKKYENFTNSGLPQRLMLYEKGVWKNAPDPIISLARKSFEAKKSITEEVAFRGHLLMFDFMRMVQIDLTSGLQWPLAWIDDSGVCFFPELGQHGYSCRGVEHAESKEPNGFREIDVHLEIGFSDLNESKSGGKENVSNCRLMQPKTIPGYAVNSDGIDVKRNFPHKIVCENYCPDGLDFGPVRLDKTCDNYIITQKMFLGGFGEYMDSNNVDGIYRSPSEILSVKNRFNLFQKQVELTGNSRGNANVKYGWLACSWQAAKELLSHGFRDSLMAKLKHTMYSGGVVFGPSNCSPLSACNSDVDENGLHHLVLCRIIMGNMEVVCSDSEQFQATSENFDSGVDSVENPKLYVVWNNKVNTHIFPEYTVSFRMCQHDKEMLVGDGSKSGMSVITSSAQLERTYCRLDSISSPAKKMEEYSLQRDSLKNPNVPASPWVPFPMLFAAISNKISCKDKELVDRYYNDYQRKKLSRMELIKHLRIVVGDNILKSTIMCLHKTSVTCRKPVQKMKLVTDLIT